MRKLIYFVACTVDRFIAHEDGSFGGFLMEGEHVEDLLKNFPESMPVHFREKLSITDENQHFDGVLMGRKTYEVGVKEGITNPYPHLQQYVFSRFLKESPDPMVELVSTDVKEFVENLKQQPGKDLWLCGGGELAGDLFPAIDELILKVHPILFGSGIPLFSGVSQFAALELISHKIYSNGFMLLHYRLKR